MYLKRQHYNSYIFHHSTDLLTFNPHFCHLEYVKKTSFNSLPHMSKEWGRSLFFFSFFLLKSFPLLTGEKRFKESLWGGVGLLTHLSIPYLAVRGT